MREQASGDHPRIVSYGQLTEQDKMHHRTELYRTTPYVRGWPGPRDAGWPQRNRWLSAAGQPLSAPAGNIITVNLPVRILLDKLMRHCVFKKSLEKITALSYMYI
jgi:hypothetical protein